MEHQSSVTSPRRRVFAGAGIDLVGDVFGDDRNRPVILLHGGGQTRHSWISAARELAQRGYLAVSVDLRGHGDSGWADDGDYRMSAFRDDVLALVGQFTVRPVLVGASLGGLASLLAMGESDIPIAVGLVLVDITSRVELSGVHRIQAFMNAHLDGFATLEAVADAIAAYNPNRPRPRNIPGLSKNVRFRDGRYFWHWDPAFLTQPDVLEPDYFDRLDAAAGKIAVPTLLVKGAESEIVSEETLAQMRALMPHAEIADIAGAGHMVVGDRNDVFNNTILGFLERRGLVPFVG